MRKTFIAFAYIFILFIVLKASFTFYSSEFLDKNGQYYHSITGSHNLYLIQIEYLPLYLIIEKRYIQYDKNINTNAQL